MARKIKFSKIYRSDISTFDKNSPDDGFLFKEQKYDEKGNLLWEIQYARNGRREIITDNYYSEENMLVAKEVSYPQDNTQEKTTRRYNGNGNVTEECLFYDGELYLLQKNIYNEKNLQIAAENYDDENTLTGKESFEYNSQDILSSQAHYNEVGEKDWQIDFFYDEKKQCTKELHTNFVENSTETILFSYNEAGKNIRSETCDADGNISAYVEVTYDENNRPVKYISETMGYSISKFINQITYNEAGKIMENEYYDVLLGQLSSRESYEYDDEGNLKKEEQFEWRNQNDKKTHYRLQYSYEYYLEQNTENHA